MGVVCEIGLDPLHLRLVEENRFALAVEEEAGGIASFAGIVLHSQLPGGNHVGAPGVQPDRTDRLAPEHPGGLQDQILVEGQGSAHIIELRIRDHVGIALVEDAHHIEAVPQQAGALDVLEQEHLLLTGGHPPEGADQHPRPHMVAMVDGLVDIAQLVEVVRRLQALHPFFQFAVGRRGSGGERLGGFQLIVELLMPGRLVFVLQHFFLQPLFQLVKIDQAAFFADGLFDVLETGSAEHFQDLDLA